MQDVFSQPLFGPVFLEFTQRKGDERFDEGNFNALCESMERDQKRRGILQVKQGLCHSLDLER